jgi:hypothetical protein
MLGFYSTFFKFYLNFVVQIFNFIQVLLIIFDEKAINIVFKN